MILRHLGGVRVKKNFLLRIEEEVFDKVKNISEVDERSINFAMCKLIDKALNGINLDKSIEKEIEEFASKSRMTKSELIEVMWNTYKKTCR